MVLQEFIYRFVFAVLVGSLIGIEREYIRHKKDFKGLPIFGIRTIILFTLLGFFFSFFSIYVEAPYLIALGVITALLVATAVYVSNVWTKKYTGATTYITALIVFFLGAIVGIGGNTNFMIAAIGAIVTTMFLAGKNFLTEWAKRLKEEELFATIKFGIIAFIILPLLPNRALDPFGIFNPYQIWYVVVLVSAIYFVSYLFMKYFSEKGLLVSSLFGGLISGSITTYQIAEWVKKNKKLLGVATTGVFLAIATGILGDIFAIAFVFRKWDLLLKILPVQATAILFMVIASFFTYKQRKKIPKFELKLGSPFALKPALKFGFLYLGLLTFNVIIVNYFGAFGIYPVAIVASLVSSSTFIISTASLYALGQISLIEATKLIILSTIIAFLIKIFWIQNSKNKEFIRKVTIMTLVGSVLMGLVLLAQLFLF